jgi:beta-mannanase
VRILRKVKSNRQKLIKACDDLFRQIIRLRDKVCQVTGRKEKAQVAHFYTRGNLRVRWDEDNACLLNAAKHIWWAHANPEQFKEFWIKRIGERRFDVLTLKARYVAPVKEFDLICIREQLKKRLEELKNGK